MNVTVIDILYIRKGLYGIVYTATCDCGCKQSRHILNHMAAQKPSKSAAEIVAKEDYENNH